MNMFLPTSGQPSSPSHLPIRAEPSRRRAYFCHDNQPAGEFLCSQHMREFLVVANKLTNMCVRERANINALKEATAALETNPDCGVLQCEVLRLQDDHNRLKAEHAKESLKLKEINQRTWISDQMAQTQESNQSSSEAQPRGERELAFFSAVFYPLATFSCFNQALDCLEHFVPWHRVFRYPRGKASMQCL